MFGISVSFPACLLRFSELLWSDDLEPEVAEEVENLIAGGDVEISFRKTEYHECNLWKEVCLMSDWSYRGPSCII